jgi:hypothetical protein
MPTLRLLSLPLVVLLGACAPTTRALPVRVLSVEAPHAAPQREPESATPERSEPPRIGAPGGSGAGSRRVAPAPRATDAQSGNETVGFLPVGIGGMTGPLG